MKSTNLFFDIISSSIISLIWQKKVISRVEIANTLRIDKSTVTKYVTKLLENEIICEIAEGKVGPQGGRKPILLEINASFAGIGGIEINSERFICTVLNMHGDILFQLQKNISPEIFTFLGLKGIFEYAYEIISAEVKHLNIPLLAIGVGTPGIIDCKNGLIVKSMTLLIDTVYNFLEDAQQISSVPVFIDNDARSCCYGEKLIHRDSPLENALFLLLEYRLTEPQISSKKNLSVGIGFIIDNKNYAGPDHLAGEFRSILWTKEYGGQFSARVAMIDDTKEHTISFDSAYIELAKHIAFLVNILNLKTVYVGGIKFETLQILQKEIETQIDYLFPHETVPDCQVRSCSVGSLAVAYGAAAMCLEKFFGNDENLRFSKAFDEFLEKKLK
ncbi:MAG: ROK family protein [Spirochaetales bacterium]